MTPIQEIEKAAKTFSHARDTLTKVISDINKITEEIYRTYRPDIKNAVANCAMHEAQLKLLIAEYPGEFEKPRTVILHGIKVGYRKGTGSMEWDDDDTVIKLIKKHFAEQAEVLIRTTEKPVKDALENLPGADLKKLGITVEETGDVIVIKPVDTAVDKTVKALLKSAAAQLEEKE